MFFNKKKQKRQYVPSVQDQRVINNFWESTLQELETEVYNPCLKSMWPEKYNNSNQIGIILD